MLAESSFDSGLPPLELTVLGTHKESILLTEAGWFIDKLQESALRPRPQQEDI
jgi:hypothetical protein